MSISHNVTVYDTSTDERIASGATANLINDAENAQLWASSWSSPPTVGGIYRLTADALLDWTGVLTGGQGSQASPYNLTVTDSERARGLAKRKATAT